MSVPTASIIQTNPLVHPNVSSPYLNRSSPLPFLSVIASTKNFFYLLRFLQNTFLETELNTTWEIFRLYVNLICDFAFLARKAKVETVVFRGIGFLVTDSLCWQNGMGGWGEDKAALLSFVAFILGGGEIGEFFVVWHLILNCIRFASKVRVNRIWTKTLQASILVFSHVVELSPCGKNRLICCETEVYFIPYTIEWCILLPIDLLHVPFNCDGVNFHNTHGLEILTSENRPAKWKHCWSG